MIGVIVISHGALAKELVKSAQMLMGEAAQLEFDGIMPEDSSDVFLERVAASIERVNTGSGVAVLVDLFGGTPSNVAFRLSRELNVKIVTGTNLPMVMYAISERTEEMTLEEFASGVLETGSSGISGFPAPMPEVTI